MPQYQSYAEVPNNTNSKWWKDAGLRKNMITVAILWANAWTWGYDGTLLNALQAMPQWMGYFGNPSGDSLGLIAFIFYAPAIVTPFIGSFFADRFGRRITLTVAVFISICGAVLNTFTKNLGGLLGGRALMGAALGVQSTIGPPLMQEICHPRLRARASALWFIAYQFGTVVAAWFAFGTLSWQSEWSWRLPTLFQALGTGILFVYTLCGQMPESPRYLVSIGKDDEAARTLANHHANGDVDDALVQYELAEIKAGLAADKGASSYLDLFRTPGNRRRMMVLIFIAVSGQFCGNALLMINLAPILKTVGITGPRQIAGINGGLAIFSTLNSAVSAQFVERWGRRPLWLTCMSGVTVIFVIITALSGSYASTGNKATGIAVIPMLYLFFLFYNAGWIVNGALYTTEILPYGIRTKALSVYVFFQTAAIAFNQYVNPIGLDNIHWKYYIVFVVLNFIWAVTAYFFLKETKGYTLEEVNRLFDGDDAAEHVTDVGMSVDSGDEKAEKA